MDELTALIGGNMFMLDLLFVSFLSLVKFEKRRFWFISMPILGVLCVVLSYYSSHLLQEIMPSGVARQFVAYTLQFIYLIAALMGIYKTNISKSIFIATYAYFIQHFTFCLDRVMRGELKLENIGVVLSHFGILLAVVAIYWILYFHKVTSYGMDKINLFQAALISLVLLFVCIFLNSYSQEQGEDSVTYRLAIVFCCFVGILLQFCLYSVSYTKISKQQLKQFYEEKAKQFEISKENISIINVKVHDLKHLMNEYHELGKIDEKSLSDMKNVIDTYDARIDTTHNQALDTILTEKSLLCKKKGVTFTALCEGRNINFINQTDLYIFFANAIDNSMEAIEKIEDRDYKVISVTARQREEIYYICVRNYYKDEPKFDGKGQLVTSKSDKTYHGFGSKSMEMFVNKYNGEIDFIKKDGVFTLNAAIPIKASEDTSKDTKPNFDFKKTAKRLWGKLVEEFK